MSGVREGSEVADLGEKSDRGEGVNPAQAPESRDQRRPRAGGGLLSNESVKAVSSGEQHLVAAEMLSEGQLQ